MGSMEDCSLEKQFENDIDLWNNMTDGAFLCVEFDVKEEVMYSAHCKKLERCNMTCNIGE